MELRRGEDGWICSRRGRAMLHKNMGISAKRPNMVNVRQESGLEDGAGGIDGVWASREVLPVLCKLFLKLNKQRLGKSRT